MKGRLGVVVAARSGSTRLPGKALKPFAGMPMLTFLLRRISASRLADVVALATTELPEDDVLEQIAVGEGMPVVRGSSANVVARYVLAAERLHLDWVARVTADCPFLDASFLDFCIERCTELPDFDLATTKGRFPVGIDVEIYSAIRMEEAHAQRELSAEDREHLTKYFYDHPAEYRIAGIEPPPRWRPAGGATFTVDTAADYDFACTILEKAGGGCDVPLSNLIDAAR